MVTLSLVLAYAVAVTAASLPNIQRRDPYCGAKARLPCDPGIEHPCCTGAGELAQCVPRIPTKDDYSIGIWSTTTCPRDDGCTTDGGYSHCKAP